MEIEIITVNYKTPDLIDRLITSVRLFSQIPIRVIDGSDTKESQRLSKEVCEKHNVTIEQLGYNIHHGRGLDYGILTSTRDYCLCLDSDVEILEGMFECFKFTHMLEGFCYNCDVGRNYLHPEICLVNVAKYKESPYKFVKHGAPAIEVNKNKDKLCMDNDYKKYYIRHGRGTCERFGYNL